ncbi:MAG: LysR family transcriptional regulator, partial [Actinobacteria bacterium]|nr:LysR family transcriptional regulator [Actinomycetota bacterium]
MNDNTSLWRQSVPTRGHSLDDLRLFAAVARAGGFTAAARSLDVPKQTISRRIALLERSLGVRLLHRTTRRTRLTDVGADFATRCEEIVRLAEEAAHEASSTRSEPSGVLRITADPVLGETFLPDLVVAFAAAWPDVGVEVLLTRRHVDLEGEGFDLAFRIGRRPSPSLDATSLGPARVHFCASPSYLEAHGMPAGPADLERHSCVILDGHDAWPGLL